ncbi:MAG: hypothetical protein LBF22_04600 [Deltaproteobacteria bacterium]|jgi:hypothetical protein|nr:hypothetical protein [Deltaproteobacteria bacterium]
MPYTSRKIAMNGFCDGERLEDYFLKKDSRKIDSRKKDSRKKDSRKAQIQEQT